MQIARFILLACVTTSAFATAAGILRGAPDDWRQQTREQKAAINQFHIAAVAEHFRGASKSRKAAAESLPLDQRLANYILEGSKDGLVADLDRKLAEGMAPLDVINGPLMAGWATSTTCTALPWRASRLPSRRSSSSRSTSR